MDTTGKASLRNKKGDRKSGRLFHISKKTQIPVPISVAKKTTVSQPRLPRSPPQLHHKNTTPNHPLFAKNPAKTPTPPQPTFFYQLH